MRNLGVLLAFFAPAVVAGPPATETRIAIDGLAPVRAVAMLLPRKESRDFPRLPVVDRLDAGALPVDGDSPSDPRPLVEKYYDFSTGFLRPKATLNVTFWLRRAPDSASVRSPAQWRDLLVRRLEPAGVRFEASLPDHAGSNRPIALRGVVADRTTNYYLYPVSSSVYAELAFSYIGPRGGWERKANALERRTVASVRFEPEDER